MSDDRSEVLDANIVILPEEPLRQIGNAMTLFESGKLASFMKKPLTLGQGLSLDVALGTTTGTYQIESMRSQKVVVISPLRIEVHDRSGESDFEETDIPETMIALARALGVERLKAIGANWEIMFKLSEDIVASEVIAKKLLREDTSFIPQNMKLVGGTARLFLSSPSGVMHTLVIEPRLQNPQTSELWMTCNANLTNPERLSIGLLREMFQQSYQLLFAVQESLFPAP